MTVVALVPSKDRAESTARTVSALLATGAVDRVLVIDDGSGDDTAIRAHAAGARVLRLGRNRGKAGAIAAGVEAEPDADVYLLIDADIAEDARFAPELLAPVLADEADLVIGVLPAAGSRGGFGLVRRFARWGVRRGSGFDGTAPLSGQRAVRGRFLRQMGGVSRFGLEVAMTIDAARAGARIREVPVPMEHQHTGRSLAGFRHRAFQGRDVAAALWPRLVPGTWRRIALVVLVLGLLGLSLVTSRIGSATGQVLPDRFEQVVIVGVPHLGLDDLDPEVMPNLERLAGTGATGMMTVRSRGGTASDAAYATLGAASQVGVPTSADTIVDRDAQVEGGAAIDVLQRRTGHRPSGDVLVLTMPQARRATSSYANSAPGSLGDALAAAGLGTAVIANSDTVDDDGNRLRRAPAGWALATAGGAVGAGTVGAELVRSDPVRPFGLTADLEAFRTAFGSVADHSAVVVLDAGDTDRVAAYAAGMLPDEADAARQVALRTTDELIGAVEGELADDTLLVVAGLSPPGSQAELVPLVLAGDGVGPARLESPSTGRAGLVTLTDLAPTILSVLDVPVPADMVGRPLQASAGQADLDAFRSTNDRIVDRNRSYPAFLDSFVNAQVVLYVLALLALLRTDTPPVVRRLLRFLFVAVTLVPLLTFLLRGFPWLGSFGGGSVVILYGLALLGAWALHDRGRTPWSPLVAVTVATLVVISGDLMAGGHLQEAGLLGYLPTTAARFTGLGNAAYGLLAASAVIVMAWMVCRSVRPRDAWWGAAAVGVIVIAVDGAPWLGSDVGGILSLVPALGILLFLLSGRRISWKVVVVPVAAAVAVLGAVVAYEALQPPADRDHIGRFFLGGGDGGTLGTTIGRKISTNISLLSSSTWSRLLPVVGIFIVLVYLFGRCWQRILPPRSVPRQALVGLFIVTVLGYALNDSGAMAAALMFVYVGAFVALPALSDPTPPDEVLETSATLDRPDRPSVVVGPTPGNQG